MIRVDANYIIRYFVNDNEKMAEIAEETLMNEEVFVSHEVLAEVVYVLGGVYDIPKKEISLKQTVNIAKLECMGGEIKTDVKSYKFL